MNKKGYSIGFTWVFALITLFGIGVLYIVFDQVFVAHLVPTIKSQVNSTTGNIPLDEQAQIIGEIDKYMVYWHFAPYVLFTVVCIYMIVAAVRKEREESAGG